MRNSSQFHRPDRTRDFIYGNTNGRRSVLWYEPYSGQSDPRVRAILRRAINRAIGSTKALIAVRSLPVQGSSDAEERARATIAAGWQNSFFEMLEILTAEGLPYHSERLIEAAVDLGLDTQQFDADLTSERTLARLAEDRELAAATGRANGPILLIDGRPYEGVWDETSLIEALEKPLGLRLTTAGADFFHWAAAGGLVLILATIAALAIANSPLHSSYEHLRESVASLGWNDAKFSLSVEQWVNDGLMTVFFLIVGIEIKREVVAGELSNPSRAALPVVAAIGGMAVPAAFFALINSGEATVHGWGVPMATDIAFTLGLLALLGRRVPVSLRVFLSALAIADDLGAIVVIAIFYSSGVEAAPLVLAGVILLAMVGMNRARIYARWPYMLLCVLLWAAIFSGGLHATLAGVLTALAIPSRRPANVHGIAAQTREMMKAEASQSGENDAFNAPTVDRLSIILERLREPGAHLQKALEHWTNFLILPLFAFFNTGLILSSASFNFAAPASLGVIVGLVIGKPVGICLASWIALRLGWATKSSEINWRHLIGAGCLAGIGFTMSIFIASAAFAGETLDSVKLSILIASLLSAIIGMTILSRAPVTKSSNAQPD